MARKKLDEMNNGELYRAYKKRKILAKTGKWASIITPFIVVFAIKSKEYIQILGEDEKYKLTVGCILAVILAGIAIIAEFKKVEKLKPFLSVIRWGLAFAIVHFLRVALQDLELIIGTEFAGQVVAKGFDYYDLYAASEEAEYKKLARGEGTLIKKSKVKEKEEKPIVNDDVRGLI